MLRRNLFFSADLLKLCNTSPPPRSLSFKWSLSHANVQGWKIKSARMVVRRQGWLIRQSIKINRRGFITVRSPDPHLESDFLRNYNSVFTARWVQWPASGAPSLLQWVFYALFASGDFSTWKLLLIVLLRFRPPQDSFYYSLFRVLRLCAATRCAREQLHCSLVHFRKSLFLKMRPDVIQKRQ